MKFMFQSEARIYFVMNYITGGELYSTLLDHKKFSEKIAKFYAAQIISAIGVLHDHDVMHKDLKMENILLDSSGYLQIIDFGLAEVVSDE